MTTDFDMPGTGTWEVRGGWVVRALMKDAGLSIEQAAGLVGNLGYESAGFATLQEITPLVAGSKGGYGWAQWTGSRRRNFEQWCAENALFPHSDEANYGFLLHELRGDYKALATRLRRTKLIETACRLVHKEYETPSDVLDGSYRSGPARLQWARRALAGAMAEGQPPQKDAAVAVECLRAIQAVLRINGHYALPDGSPGVLDGDFGERSRAAFNDVLRAAGQPGI